MALGDHLVVTLGFYTHHGIDMGDDTVIHCDVGAPDRQLPLFNFARLLLTRKRPARIIRSTREEFSRGRKVWVFEHAHSLSAEETAARAISKLGVQDYDLCENNCEHFATWCKTGQAASSQVRAYERRFRTVAWKAALLQSLARSAARQTAGTVHKVLAKGASPWLLAADAAQLAATVVAHNSGLPSKHAETVGRGIGLGGSVVIGAVAGGPLGAGIAAAVWTLGETVR